MTDYYLITAALHPVSLSSNRPFYEEAANWANTWPAYYVSNGLDWPAYYKRAQYNKWAYYEPISSSDRSTKKSF